MARQKRNTGSMTRRGFLTLAGAGAGLFVLEACAPSALTPTPEVTPAGEVQRGGTLRVAFPGTPGQLDPALLLSEEDSTIAMAVYNGLVRLDHNLTVQPDLAESWMPAEDLTTWTFKLREGVQFEHGTPFTADDVVYTFERVLDPALASPARSLLNFVDRVEKVDDHTVQFLLNSPHAELHTILGGRLLRIVPHDRTGEQLGAEPSGTGPFTLSDYLPGDHTTLVRKEDYWQPDLPYLDEVRHVYMPEEATQIAALGDRSIDLMWQLGFENIATVEAMPSARVGEVSSGLYQPVVMQTRSEPFTDNRVRLALKHCVDREGMRQVVSQGRGDLGNDQPIPPINPFWADIPMREQNIERARELLAEAGYADGLDLTLHTSSVRPGMVEQAVAFQEMARPAGIRVQIERVPPDVFWSETWMKVPLFVSNWVLRVTADETLANAYHSEAEWNESEFRRPELDRLIEEARAERDEERRQELYAEAQRLISEEGGVIVAFFKPVVMAVRTEVQEFHPHPSAWLDFRATWLAES